MTFSVTSRLLLALVPCLAVACQGPQVPPQVVQHMESVQTEMRLGRQAILRAGVSARDLKDSDAKDLSPKFATFKELLAQLESKAGGVGLVVDMQQNQSDKYFTNWEKEINQLADEDMRSRALDRRADAEKTYREIKNKIVTLKGSFKPYITNLRDVQRSLSADTTPAGLKAVKPIIEKALDQQPAVLQDLDAVMSAIDQLGTR